MHTPKKTGLRIKKHPYPVSPTASDLSLNSNRCAWKCGLVTRQKERQTMYVHTTSRLYSFEESFWTKVNGA